ncbi:MAG TPA: hypothetical protein DDX39_06900 [Bacteroidales bacterium]|nr:MAG: hypothetical protein A2W98_15005 [Bacteroidetes bacterium GWF2_33_38]OFY72930.1 MAG: hypothetical protein A2265_07780 [Bacteroidetes bacterium RIFOXYA12_FULL_33_9]OFY91438.1 MAG: hypothetical protein A2236_03375 [Bacteroidetes bacterium RIFOXYA2_FULL_33_7]HBF88356.1 hypothetical protein [Bacteroidales bacterium]
MKLYKSFLFVSLLFAQSIFAQIVSVTPPYPSITDSVTIIFDATQGNGELVGVSPVYMHTGVITSESVNEADWLHKIAEWGEDDTLVLMEDIGNNHHKMTFHVRDFYGLSSTEGAQEMAFVFRNVDGSKAGKNADGSDVYVHLYETNQFARFTAPIEFPLDLNIGETTTITVSAKENAMINLFHEGNLVAQTYGTSLSWTLNPTQTGKFWFWFEAQSGGETIIDSVYYIVQTEQIIADIPSGTVDGINYVNDSTVILCLFAPYKDFVYLISDLSNWEVSPEYMLNKTPDGNRYWIQLTGLEPLKEYGFQYFVDFEINIADPYADKFLDRWNDSKIHPIIYPNLKPYPFGKTSEMVSIFQTGQEDYEWEVPNFTKPDQRDLVVYELLVRDFHLWHNYQTVLDSIEYLKGLGINAIELMPVMEFDGNDSWGYMTAFYFAPDKDYGTKSMLKHFIDEAHKNGMAVILDIVLNHASGQNSMARLYKNKDTGKTTSENPWFNERIPHPYGYHHDFNHASYYTQDFVDRVLDYWVSEYNIDGYRMDLSKGFTNNVTVGYDEEGDIIWTDVGAWGNYDSDRVYFLQRMANELWASHPGKYIILEHLASFDEEVVLSNHGFMLWCGQSANGQFRQAAMGYTDNSDFKYGISYQNYQGNNLGKHNLVGYMESHDEERLMYECLTYGNEYYADGDTIPTYSIKDKTTAIERMGLAAAFFFSVPGPKMFWQFGERGYDYSINWPAIEEPGVTRTNKKPPLWEYMTDTNRIRLYKTYAALIKLKTENILFRTSNFEMSTSNYDKRIRLWDDGYVGTDMAAVILGNFNVQTQSVWPEFSHTGWWYDYLSGDSIYVENAQIEGNNFTFQYEAGEYHIYTDKKLETPDLSVPKEDGINEFYTASEYSYAYPNPFNNSITIGLNLNEPQKIEISVYNLLGKKVATIVDKKLSSGTYEFIWNGVNNETEIQQNGYYIYIVKAESFTDSGKILKY